MVLGRFEAGLAALTAGEHLDPLSLMANTHVAVGCYLTRKHAQAKEACRAALELDLNFWVAHYFLGLIYEQEGRLAQGIGELQRAQELSQKSPLPTASLGHAYARAGSTWEATRILHELKANSSRYVPHFALALIQAGFRKKDATLEELRKAFEEHSPLLGLWLTVEPRLDFLRSDSRFRDLVTKMRLPPERAALQ